MRRAVALCNGYGDHVVVGHNVHVVNQGGNVYRLCDFFRRRRGGNLRGGRVVDRGHIDVERYFRVPAVAVRHAQLDRRRAVLVVLRVDRNGPVSVLVMRARHAAFVHQRGVRAADKRHIQVRQRGFHVGHDNAVHAVVGILRQVHGGGRGAEHRQVVDARHVDFVGANRRSAEFVLHRVRYLCLSGPVLRWRKGNRIARG